MRGTVGETLERLILLQVGAAAATHATTGTTCRRSSQDGLHAAQAVKPVLLYSPAPPIVLPETLGLPSQAGIAADGRPEQTLSS